VGLGACPVEIIWDRDFVVFGGWVVIFALVGGFESSGLWKRLRRSSILNN
jgi:hypothetical protein